MPNGGVTPFCFILRNILETCQDVLFYVAQVLGGFFINREKTGTESTGRIL